MWRFVLSVATEVHDVPAIPWYEPMKRSEDYHECRRGGSPKHQKMVVCTKRKKDREKFQILFDFPGKSTEVGDFWVWQSMNGWWIIANIQGRISNKLNTQTINWMQKSSPLISWKGISSKIVFLRTLQRTLYFLNKRRLANFWSCIFNPKLKFQLRFFRDSILLLQANRPENRLKCPLKGSRIVSQA